MLVIQAENINRTLPLGGETIPILHNISFEVARGEWMALTGPSGSGKSTLLGILGGIDIPTNGTLKLDDVDITRLNERKLAKIRNEKIGFVFQSFNLIPSLTAQENVEVPLYIHPKAHRASELAKEMLALVGLSDRLNHRPHQLSGGQQQRVAIARALVTQPTLLLADEPTGNLDSAASQQILDLFGRVRQEFNITLMMATHDPMVAGCADRVLHLVDGRVQ
jgi:putative ABC transport system ATP-binding protein